MEPSSINLIIFGIGLGLLIFWDDVEELFKK